MNELLEAIQIAVTMISVAQQIIANSITLEEMQVMVR